MLLRAVFSLATLVAAQVPEPTPPPFNATVIAAFAAKTLANPLPAPAANPYSKPNPPLPKPGQVCGVLYSNETKRRVYRLETYVSAAAAVAAGAHVTHDTPCGLCSSLADLAAYMKHWDMTAVRALLLALSSLLSSLLASLLSSLLSSLLTSAQSRCATAESRARSRAPPGSAASPGWG